MKYISCFVLMASTVLVFSSCEKKFLEAEQVGTVILSDTRDYDLLLNSDMISTIRSWPVIMLSDDVQLSDPLRPSGTAESQRMYSWQDDIYGDKDPVMWTNQYHSIYHNNLVINEVDAAIGGTPGEKAALKAEARLGRAFAHLLLLNVFARPFDATGANTDPGIPYVESSDMYAPLPERATVMQTYQKIIQDIESAIPLLPTLAEFNHRGSKAAAYGLLSRVYLLMMQYEKVMEYADKALALNSSLLNYTTTGFVRPAGQDNIENIYLRQVTEAVVSRLAPVAAYAALLPATDARKRLFTPSNTFRTLVSQQTGITVQEVMMNKAEALVRKQAPDINGALDLVNKLNAKRNTAPVVLSTTQVSEALTWVLNERRREMAASGLRWMDTRRLAKEGRVPIITRQLLGVAYTLTPDSKKYVLLIPKPVILFNPGMPQNER